MITKIDESGVSELIGSLALIIIIGVGISIAGVYMLSNPVPQKIPSIRANFSYDNTTRNLTIHHNGGDPLNLNELYLMVDTGKGLTEKHTYTLSGGNGYEWSVGNDIIIQNINQVPDKFNIVYQGSGSEVVILSVDSNAFKMPASGFNLSKY